MSPRTVFAPYVRLFAVPGTRAFTLAGWLARMPISMLPLGVLLLVEGETGSYALAGAVSGVFSVARGFAGPQWARAMDRRGQGPVLRVSMAAFALTGVVFVVAVIAGAPSWSWFPLAAASGASGPNISSLIRVRWSAALEPGGLQAAYAFEAVADEVAFVLGPPLVAFLAALVAPPLGFVTGLVAGVVGGLWLAGQRATEPASRPVVAGGARRRGAALPPSVLVVVVAYAAMGALFGGVDVVVVAFAEAEGAPALSGVALAMFAAGSLVAGLAYGVVRVPGTLATRFVGSTLAFGVAAQMLWGVGSLPVLIACGFLAGMTTAPVLVSGASLVESRVAPGVLTESLSWTITGMTVGLVGGSALAGVAVDAWGAQDAFAVPAVAAALAGLLALAGAPLLRGPAEVPRDPAATPVEQRAGG